MFYVRPKKSVLSKIATFCCVWIKIGESLTRERMVKMKISIKVLLKGGLRNQSALEPSFLEIGAKMATPQEESRTKKQKSAIKPVFLKNPPDL